MGQASVRIDEVVIQHARIASKAQHRSFAKQLEHWATVGQIAQENPGMTYEMIIHLLQSREEVKAGETEPFALPKKRSRS